MNLFTVAIAVSLMALTTALLAEPTLSFYEREQQRTIIEASLRLGERYVATHCGSLPASVTFETAVPELGNDVDGLGSLELIAWELRFTEGVGTLVVTDPTPIVQSLLVSEFGGVIDVDEVEVPFRKAQRRSPAHSRVFTRLLAGGISC